jgi:hypothetical protein
VTEDEVHLVCVSDAGLTLRWNCAYLVGGTTLVRAKHDHVGRRVGELLGVESFVVLEELHVGTTTFQTIYSTISTDFLARGDTSDIYLEA